MLKALWKPTKYSLHKVIQSWGKCKHKSNYLNCLTSTGNGGVTYFFPQKEKRKRKYQAQCYQSKEHMNNLHYYVSNINVPRKKQNLGVRRSFLGCTPVSILSKTKSYEGKQQNFSNTKQQIGNWNDSMRTQLKSLKQGNNHKKPSDLIA